MLHGATLAARILIRLLTVDTRPRVVLPAPRGEVASRHTQVESRNERQELFWRHESPHAIKPLEMQKVRKDIVLRGR
jgi:hypothetical protein